MLPFYKNVMGKYYKDGIEICCSRSNLATIYLSTKITENQRILDDILD